MDTVCVIVPSLELGGAERSAAKFANVLSAGGVQVHLFCMASANTQVLSELSSHVAVKIAKGKSSLDLRMLLKLYLHLKRIKPAVVVGWSTYANLATIVTARLAGARKIVISERNYVPRMFARDSVSRLRRKVVLGLMKALYPKADLLTANAHLSLRFLRRFVRMHGKSAVLPNLFDAVRSDAMATANPINCGRNDSSPRLLAVGRLERQKGFDLLLRSFAVVLKTEGWQLRIAGTGTEEALLHELARALNIEENVEFLGKVENPFPLYGWADIVIVPSRYEGFPNVPLEAMGMGAAVIVSDCKSGPRELTANGRFGVLVPVGDVNALAGAILALGRSPDTTRLLGQAARAHVRDRYGEATVAKVYRQILGLGSTST